MRTILYYPYIEVPTAGVWIRRALLYWDRVAAIVPHSYSYGRRLDDRFSPDLQFLFHERVFHPISPGGMFRRQTLFQTELLDALDLYERTRAKRTTPLTYVQIYKDKSTWEIQERLAQTGLTQPARDERVFFLETEFATLYMSALAKHVAADQQEFTIPGTDDPTYMTRQFPPDRRGRMEPVLSLSFHDIIPVPQVDVPLPKILRFKEDYQSELASFRAAMDEHDNRIARAESVEHAKHEVQSLRDAIKRDVKDLGRAMRDSKIDMVWGSLQAFIKPTTPTLLGAGLVAAGIATSIATLPISAIALGAGAGGVIQLGQHLQSNLVQRRQTRERHPFAYLFLAKKKFSLAGRR